jgi:hypothetical protein
MTDAYRVGMEFSRKPRTATEIMREMEIEDGLLTEAYHRNLAGSPDYLQAVAKMGDIARRLVNTQLNPIYEARSW